MSALFTALVEGETKETLAASLLEHRAALRVLLADYRTEGCPDPKCGICKRSKAAEAQANAVLDTMVFREAGNRDRVEVSVCTKPGFCNTDQCCVVCGGRTPECAFGGCRREEPVNPAGETKRCHAGNGPCPGQCRLKHKPECTCGSYGKDHSWRCAISYEARKACRHA
jgi:hypothetical protein